jgi:hypothetical protein
MKTLEFIKENYKSETFDGRDSSRLAQFVPFEMFPFLDISLTEGTTKEQWEEHRIELTKENILKQLEKDIEFGFEKALNQRGLSANMMAEVVQMWNWILEEGLESFDEYAQYGLPIFKATALKYGFNNPIGDDKGDENKYSADSGE